MIWENFRINGVQILVFRKPLTSRGKLPFSQNFSQVVGREETMKSLILLNMCYDKSTLFMKLWMLPLNSGFLLVRKRRNSLFIRSPPFFKILYTYPFIKTFQLTSSPN